MIASMALTHRDLRERFFFALLLGVLVLTVFLFLPYLATLAVAATFAVILQPVYRVILVRVRDSRGIAALLTMLLTGLLVFVPLTVLALQMVQEATSLYVTLSQNPDFLSKDLLGSVQALISGRVDI